MSIITNETGKDSENIRERKMIMSGLNMPSRIESGETTVSDKWRVIRIILYVLGAGLLIGFGIGYLF